MSREILAALVLTALAVFAWVFHHRPERTRECCQEIVLGNSQVQSKIFAVEMRLDPAVPAPGQQVTTYAAWRPGSCPGCVVLVNVFGDWDKDAPLGNLYGGNNTAQQGTFTFTAPPTTGRHFLKLIWAYDIGGFADYTGCNLPSQAQMDAWGGGGECYFFKKGFEVR